MDIKEELCFLDFCSDNERDTKGLVKNVKIETVTCNSDIKPEVEDPTCSENEHYLLGFNETTKESEIETKIHIKEEYCWLKSEDSCINDGMKDETDEFHSTNPPSLYKQDVSSDVSYLYSSEVLGNDISFNMNKDPSECEGDKKWKSQKSVVTDISLQGGKKHKLIDQGIKPQKCNIISKAFIKVSNLKKHKFNHEGIKPYKCNICNKDFTELSNLKKHKLIYENTKPHKYDICNKAYTHSFYLKIHKLIHKGIKPHRCNICNRAFTHLSSLSTHKLSHQNIKSHKCNICNKGFTSSSHLKTHILIHEGIKPHKCDICNKGFFGYHIWKDKLVQKDK